MKKLLVTGASGFLGWNICNYAQKEWEIFGTVFSRTVAIPGVHVLRVDITDFRELKNVFNEVRPDAVIHTAADSRPDYCQRHPGSSRKTNVDASINIAGLCADYQIPLAFTSSDLVFDGRNPPYREEDPVNPVSIYAEQKILAEEKVLETWPSAAVCRMALMFGDPGPGASSFFMSMVKALKEGRELKLLVDEFRTPLSGTSAAKGLLLALEKVNGLLNLGGVERISRFNFGLLMMDVLGIREATLVRCRQADLDLPAPRVPDVSLDSSKAFALGFKPLPLREELERLLKSA